MNTIKLKGIEITVEAGVEVVIEGKKITVRAAPAPTVTIYPQTPQFIAPQTWWTSPLVGDATEREPYRNVQLEPQGDVQITYTT